MTTDLWSIAQMEHGRHEAELAKRRVMIISTRQAEFIDGTTEKQWTIRDEDGICWHLVPTSRAACRRQADAGRFMSPYSWLRA